ncbi:hypothetical protein CCP3SC15_550024 [Gammaproteobacteria bacterium]
MLARQRIPNQKQRQNQNHVVSVKALCFYFIVKENKSQSFLYPFAKIAYNRKISLEIYSYVYFVPIIYIRVNYILEVTMFKSGSGGVVLNHFGPCFVWGFRAPRDSDLARRVVSVSCARMAWSAVKP